MFQERKKDLSDHREDSTFSFDPTRIPIKQLDKHNRKRLDSRKGILLSSYSRKRTRRRKRRGGFVGGVGGTASDAGSCTQSATPSPRHSSAEIVTTRPPSPKPPTPPPPPPMPKQPSPLPHLTPLTVGSDTLHPSIALGKKLLVFYLLSCFFLNELFLILVCVYYLHVSHLCMSLEW